MTKKARKAQRIGSMPHSLEFIELNRTFSDFTDSVDGEESAYSSYLATLTGAGTTWDDLLKGRCTVVLAEAGSGKSWEMQARAETIRNTGQNAFLVRVEDLTSHSLRDSVAPNSIDQFRKWYPSKERATFFLDAVDEAKITSRNAFESALRSFVNGLGRAKHSDVTVVLSSRVTGWRSQHDSRLLCDLLDLPMNLPSSGDKPPAFRVVTMDPLSHKQVELLANHHLSKEAAQFLEALNEHDAWTFARRPLDVLRLAKFWMERKSLGTLTQILEYDVQSRLRETNEDRQVSSGLSDKSLRAGAEALAAAVTFGRTFPICLENEPPGFGNPACVSPSSELPEWQPKDRQELLTRALFDPATYGAVRFHHRGVSEYLAACWINELLKCGFPLSDCLSLFFARSYGEELLITSRTAMVCWLACGAEIWNRRIREHLVAIEPIALLSHGDGARLDAVARQTLLQSIVMRLNKTTWRNWSAENEQLRRLAHPDLVPYISQTILDQDTSDECLVLLFRLVREGKFAECMPAIRKRINQPAVSDAILQFAVDAIGRAGSEADKRNLVLWLLSKAHINEPVAYQAVSTLYPNTITAAEFVKLIEKVRTTDRWSFRNITDAAEEALTNRAPPAHLRPVMEGLISLLIHMPGVTNVEGSKSFLVSRDFLWVAPVLRAAIARVFETATISSDMTDRVVSALQLVELAREARHRDEYESRKIDLQPRSLAHPGLRREYFWHKAKQFIARQPSRLPTIHSIAHHYSLLEPAKCDQSWILDDLSREYPHRHRETALRWASEIWWSFGRPSGLRSETRRRIRDNDTLLRIYGSVFHNTARLWILRGKWKVREYLKWGHKSHLRCIKKWYWRQRNLMWLLCHLNGLRRGRYIDALRYLYDAGGRRGDDDEGLRLTAIVEEYGRAIAAAYRQGCKAYWRTYTPPLRHEKDDPTRTSWSVFIGLEGLRFTFDDRIDPAILTAEEAKLATRYGTEELSGFPDWLGTLADAHPESVRQVLVECTSQDWSRPEEAAEGSHVMGRLFSGTPILHRLMSDDLLRLLWNGDPGKPGVLLDGVAVILRGDPRKTKEISQLVPARVGALAVGSSHLYPWLIVWLWLDASIAVDWLEELENRENLETLDNLYLGLAEGLGELRVRPSDARPSYESARDLHRLARLVYAHIRPEDDIERAGTGVYSPGPRDHAQEFRNRLISRLSKIPDPAAHEALLALATDPVMVRHQDYILRIAASCRQQDAEPDRWQPGDAWRLSHSFTAPVRSGHDLFSLTIRRFVSLRDELVDADFRRREGLPTNENEDRLQEWLARYLSERAQNQYTVQRESMVAYGKKPDLRVEIPSHSPTCIEVKWADDWSINELSEALSEQLVGRYMRARNSRYGVLFLGWKGKKNHWKLPTDEHIGFGALLDHLGNQASHILGNRLDINELSIFGTRFGG